MTTPQERSRAPFVLGDPLRGLAALWVAASHLLELSILTSSTPGVGGPQLNAGPAFGFLGDLFQSGGLGGVTIFFVLSGYLLARPFLRAFSFSEAPPSLLRYFRNRVLRIVPAFWVVLTLIVVALPTAGASTSDVAKAYVFFGHWWENPLGYWMPQAWTLDVEARFYVLLAAGGLVLALLPRLVAPLRRTPPWTRSAALAALLLVAAYVWRPWDGFRPYNSFLVGIALAAIETLPLRNLRRPSLAAPVLFVAGLAGLVVASLSSRGVIDSMGTWLGVVSAFSAGAVVGAPLLWQWAGRPAWRVLDNRVGRWAGSRSYSIYLVHFPAYHEAGVHIHAGDANAQLAAVGAAGTPAMLLGSELLHRFVERPFLRRRGRSQSTPGVGEGEYPGDATRDSS